jgi:hypothetical protein
MAEDNELNRRIDGVQAGMRTARAELSALHTRIGLLEHRLNLMDVRIGELPIGLEELKTHIDLRLNTLEELLRKHTVDDEDHHRRPVHANSCMPIHE